MSSPTIRAGFIGIGDMGGPMAGNLIKAGFPTTLWARRPEAFDQYAGLDFNIASSPAELGRAADVVGLCVFADKDVRDVIAGENGLLEGMAPGGIIIIHATISVEGATEIARIAAEKGIGVLDAPVSGSRSRSETGTLSIMVGGEQDVFDRALPVMQSYGKVIERLGPIGSGQKMKVLNNVLGFCNLRMGHLAIETGDKMGLEREAVMAMLRASSGQSFNLEVLIDRLLPNPAYCRHAVTMTEKDTRLFQKVCETEGIERSRMDEIAEEAILMVEKLGQE
jgi:3-hydroxyisobutyrate dehydrogenase-like beta-hydroxyacid dehydrogenase